jgi:ubiquinone/menaquinone biosynthesis C-methylase UbiE/uncharacterized protein YbaR (Trm112 family)
MKRELLEILRCPACLGTLALGSDDTANVASGSLHCDGCGREYAIRCGLPLLLLKDQNWKDTAREMVGERELTVEMPISEQLKRNRFEWKRSRDFLRNVRIPENPLILDVGGSSGIGAYLFHPFHARMVVIDIVPHFLKIAEVCLQGKMDLDCAAAAMEWLPFRDEAFDVTFCRQALHHSGEPPRAVREMFRVTRAGGVVLLLAEPCQSIIDRFRGWRRKRKRLSTQKSTGRPQTKADLVMEKLPDDRFQYLWTDFHRDLTAVSDDFNIEEASGCSAAVATADGIKYEPYVTQRRLKGKIVKHVLPFGLGRRGDINIKAVKTRPVSRRESCPDFVPVCAGDLEVGEIPPEEAQAALEFFSKCFEENG